MSIQNNTVATPTATQIGGRSWQEYTYDDLNRLTTASGNFVGRNDNGVGFNHSKYTLGMSYDSQHNITSKIQNHESATSTSAASVAGAWTQVEKTSYNLNYQDYNTADYNVAGYNYGQPHAPRTIVDQPNLAGCCDGANDPRVKTKSFEYDANGNQTQITQSICTSETPDILRENLWDEENRLRAIDLNPEANTVHPIAIYTYDAGGERIVKQNATSVAIYENAKQVGTTIKTDFMLYPSGMLVARPAADGTGALSYTKHYFAGSQRVSSKIGTTTNLGKVLQEWTLIENSSGGAPINLVSTSSDQLTTAETGVTHVYTQFGITPTPTFNSNSTFIAIPAFTGTEAETEQYFFHPDHLGSSNYITNFTGEVSQHMEYFAFGETFIEEHKNSHNAPYKFNGKELDEESGLYYYGARYYDSRISIWNAVDPMAEMFAGRSPYEYCFSNPINLIDPTGLGPEGNGDDGPPKKKVHLIMYGPGYLNYTYKGKDHDTGNGFKNSAEALKKKIEAGANFNSSIEEVKLVYTPNFKRLKETINSQADGSIISTTVFSHGYGLSDTNGTNTGGLSLGGESPREIRPDGTKVTKNEADSQLNNYDLRELNGNTISQLNSKKFDKNAIFTAYGCWVGGDKSWTDSQIQTYSFAQKIANSLGVTVKAFTGSAEFKSKNNKPIYDGTMIRSYDKINQQTRLSTYKKGVKPVLIR